METLLDSLLAAIICFGIGYCLAELITGPRKGGK
jgi:hypothetical protein